MNRRLFIHQGCACGLMFLAAQSGDTVTAEESVEPKPDLTQPIKPEQVMAVLTDIDQTKDKALIDAVFTRWGFQCFHSRPELAAFAQRQRDNFRGYVDYINSNRARYWERLEYDEPNGIIKVTSRESGRCPCAYAQCPKPAKSLCTHCCKALQIELFKTMTGRDVQVQIDESILLGGKRCRTTVRLGKTVNETS